MAVASILPGSSRASSHIACTPGRRQRFSSTRPRWTSSTVLAQQRRYVGHGAERHQVEQIRLDERRGPRRNRVLRFQAQEGLRQLEGDADAGQVPEVVGLLVLARVDHGQGRRDLLAAVSVAGNRVVIGDDDVEAERVGVATSAGERMPQSTVMTSPVPQPAMRVRAVVVQTVALVDAVRDVGLDHRSERRERLHEQSSGGHAVGVEVAVDHHPFAGLDAPPDALDSLRHAAQAEGIGAVKAAGQESRPCRPARSRRDCRGSARGAGSGASSERGTHRAFWASCSSALSSAAYLLA